MSKWWPLAGRSVSMSPEASLSIEKRAGGALFEVSPRGKRHLWNVVMVCAHANAIAYTWHPGKTLGLAKVAHVMFDALPSHGGTQVLLLHSGWEARGGAAKDIRG